MADAVFALGEVWRWADLHWRVVEMHPMPRGRTLAVLQSTMNGRRKKIFQDETRGWKRVEGDW